MADVPQEEMRDLALSSGEASPIDGGGVVVREVKIGTPEEEAEVAAQLERQDAFLTPDAAQGEDESGNDRVGPCVPPPPPTRTGNS